MEMPLVSLDSSLTPLIEEILDEFDRVNQSFEDIRMTLQEELDGLYRKYSEKTTSPSKAKEGSSQGLPEKDGFDYATSWNRVFQQLYAKFNWLTSFREINCIAIEKILAKVTNLLEDKENNSLSIALEEYLSKQPITDKKITK
eukprot:CAMPEP_0170550452 /NCGR_PEP_ID=MMETSP0211-20121228/8523_1 /TAXON_ID=311385 /ORGANISM="Pseudokeronopsis sp., Strain OXSARD2" /LENGTH=142 /DNA_ID=CAMNT_0010857017 /DNA_START=216 /DNA_END=644 /DNA_ORIENTATION=+